MRKILILSLAMALALIHYAFAAGLLKSKHDMANDCNIKKGGNQVCVFCHHPHITGSQLTANHKPIAWNEGLANYTYNTSFANDGMPANMPGINPEGAGKSLVDPPNPASGSLYCLACHDADTGLDILHHDVHPYNFMVTQADDVGIITPYQSLIPFGNDPEGNRVYVGNSPGFGKYAKYFIGYVYNSDTYPLWQGTLQCATCHNPHNGSDYGSGVEFLRNAGDTNPLIDSVICRNCHSDK